MVIWAIDLHFLCRCLPSLDLWYHWSVMIWLRWYFRGQRAYVDRQLFDEEEVVAMLECVLRMYSTYFRSRARLRPRVLSLTRHLGDWPRDTFWSYIRVFLSCSSNEPSCPRYIWAHSRAPHSWYQGNRFSTKAYLHYFGITLNAKTMPKSRQALTNDSDSLRDERQAQVLIGMAKEAINETPHFGLREH